MHGDAKNSAGWPRVDMFVSATGDYIIELELSGLRSEWLEITVQGQRLAVKGERPDPSTSICKESVAKEIPRGAFKRVMELPTEFDLTEAKAAYLNGFLRITVPSVNNR